jgi:5-formyltetrahydrofolate cyclo-ligase
MTPEERAVQAHGLRRVVMDFLVTGQDRDGRTVHAGTGSPTSAHGTIAAFVGVGTEPDTVPLLTALHRAGFDVVVPVCEPDHALSWAGWRPDVPLARSALAPVDEPTGPRRPFHVLEDVRTVLVPALGVDPSGARIGHGGGYYDRFLRQHPLGPGAGAPAMALVHRSEVLPVGAVPVDPFDQPIAGAFTADGPLFFESPRSRV